MLRVVEEVLELAQAEAVTPAEITIILYQVYGKPEGALHQELGGVMTTLAAYAATANLDLETAFWDEFERIMDPQIMEKVRTRNLAGDKIGFKKSDDDYGVGSPQDPHSFGAR
jgi:NTP pyrophosphatase (non-canonical NTP hydrolase)